MVYYGHVEDGDDVQAAMMGQSGAVSRWKPEIMLGKPPVGIFCWGCQVLPIVSQL